MFASAKAIKELASKDFNFFAALALADKFEYEFPDLFIELFELVRLSAITPRDFSKFAFGIPRGFAKTTWAKLLVCWLILHADKQFAGIAAANEPLASNIVTDIWSILTSDNIRNVYGDLTANIREDSKIKKVFKYNLKTIAIIGVGAHGSPRGWNIDHTRPDILLMDDIQTRQCAESDTETAALTTWIFSTFLYTASPKGCTTVYLGNMYPGKNSILKMLEQNPAWTSLIVGGILSNGKSLWEELHPVEQLLKNYREAEQSGTLKYFAAEILNDNEAQTAVDFSYRDFPALPPDYLDIPSGRFIIIDPSGRKKTSDKSVIALFDIFNGKPILRDLQYENLDPKSTINKCLELALKYNCSSICIENVGYQDTLLFWFEEALQNYGIDGISLYPINPAGKSKVGRIRDAILNLKAGNLYVHPSCQGTVYKQIIEWKPHKQNNTDDILDVLAYSTQALAEHGDNFPLILYDSSLAANHAVKTFDQLVEL